MTNNGFVRRVDDLGRVLIPREIRRNLGIYEGDKLDIFLNSDGAIVITPVKSNYNQAVQAFAKFFEYSTPEEKEEILKILTDKM